LRPDAAIGDHLRAMPKLNTCRRPQGHDLIALAQKLARDAERHALLSASLASQADRLMLAGLRQLERRSASGEPRAAQ
jgi:hypothetical protein